MAIENLATSRVLVVDDKPDEAVPILTALGKAGVGCVYVKGDKFEELPTKPIEGIRLVFLDMRLAEGGDSKSVLSKTVNVLKTCVDENTIPLIVVCWTRHTEDVAEFTDVVKKGFPGLKHGVIVSMPKPAQTEPSKWKNVDRKIRETLRTFEAFGLVWQWEKVLHRAATETSQTMAEVSVHMIKSDSAQPDWQGGMFSVCRELVRAEAGKKCNVKAASSALFRMINELAMDRIHYAILDRPLSCVSKLIPGPDYDLSPEDTSRLNQMILVDPVERGDSDIRPGSIYKQRRGIDSCLFKKLGVSIKLIKKDILKDKNVAGVVPILIEISPACDFAQDKRHVCMFIAGLLVPDDGLSKNKYRYEYSEVIGPIIIPRYGGIKMIVVSKRLVYAGSLRPGCISNLAICRLRSNFLVDLQVKTAMYKARPGTASLEFMKTKSADSKAKGA